MGKLTAISVLLLILFACNKEGENSENVQNNNQTTTNSSKLLRISYSEGSGYYEFEYEGNNIVKEWLYLDDTSFVNQLKIYNAQNRITDHFEDYGSGNVSVFKYDYISDDTLKVSFYKNEISNTNYQYAMFFIGNHNLPDSCYSMDNSSKRGKSFIWQDDNLISQTYSYKNIEGKSTKSTISYTYSSLLNPLRGVHSLFGMEGEIFDGDSFNYLISKNLLTERTYNTYTEGVLTETVSDYFYYIEENGRVTKHGISGQTDTLLFTYLD